MKYHLYIDEVGNSDLGSSTDPNHRYLSLTGVILEIEHDSLVVTPAIEELKRTYFDSSSNAPIILHRKELMNKNYPFESLRDPKTEQSFNKSLLGLLQNLDYAVITVIIDKLEHNRRYHRWHFDPYHYCLTAMVERYARWLQKMKAEGDVIAESRGKQDDQRLKASFERIYISGSDFVESTVFASHLTSRQLKVKTKRTNISGLQLADLIAHPSFRGALARRDNRPLPDTFGGKIEEIIESSKYIRSYSGQIDGYGRKWLP